MKKIVTSLLLSMTVYSTPHLMIHMDINRTIVATDPLQHLGVEDIVNLSLAKKFICQWEPDMPSMSYFDYVYDVKHPGERRDKALRKARRADIGNFIAMLRAEGHSLLGKAEEMLQEANQVMEGRYLFPSFLRLIQALDSKDVTYSMIFRTFGQDLDHVERALGFAIPRAHFKDGKLYTPDAILSDPGAIFAYLKAHKYLGVRDDYAYWNENNEHKEFGKQFPLEQGTEIRSVFFDDNIESHSLFNIVAPYDIHSGEHLEILPLIESGVLVPVVTIDAILDEDFFLKRIALQ